MKFDVSFAVKPDRSVGRELKRIARRELGAAADQLRTHRNIDKAIHDGRKSVKKVEALTRLLDQVGMPVRRKDIARLRDVRRTLSRLRDSEAMVETLDRLRSRFERQVPEHTWAMIRRELTRRKSEMTSRAHASAGTLARSAKTLRKLRRAAKRWEVPKVAASDLPTVLARSYRTARKAMKLAAAEPDPVHFHDWRKCTKNLWYQLRLAERLIAGATTRIAEYRELESALGEEHNLVVFRTYVTRHRAFRRMRSQIRDLASISTALQQELRRAALVLGERLLGASRKEFERDIEERLRPKGAARRKPAAKSRGPAVA